MRTAYLRRLYLRNRSLVRTVGVVIGLGLVSPVFGQTTITRSFIIDVHKKEMLEIGRPDTGHVVARDINDAGQVVGTSQSHGAFITGPNGMGMTSLGPGPYGPAYNPVGINAAGQVALSAVGRWEDSVFPHAFITGPNGRGMTRSRPALAGPSSYRDQRCGTGRGARAI